MINRSHSKKALLFFSLTGILFFAGCTKNLRYKNRKLSPLKQATAHSSSSKQGVTVHALKFDKSRRQHYFNRKKLGVKPLQLAIENKSDTEWVLLKENISLRLVEADKVTHKLQSSLGSSVALGFFINPLLGGFHGVTSYQANQRISEDIQEKALDLDVSVAPHKQKDALIFVSNKEQAKRFTVTLVDANDRNNTLDFHLIA